jgi:5'-methylthioinosine phosphorylase
VSELAIIGGTGLTKLEALKISDREIIHTPFGEPSGPLTRGHLYGREIMFLPRHGYGHTIPPHKINFRANLWALHQAGAKYVVAVAAVGGIRSDTGPSELVIPDQIIDYTYSRVTTFFEEGLQQVTHIDFTEPYAQTLRAKILAAAAAAKIEIVDGATYAATQGPRLETAAEVNRLERDGCHIVGMTGMPEAALARELELDYATCAVVANWAAGRGRGEISMKQIDIELSKGMKKVGQILEHLVALI